MKEKLWELFGRVNEGREDLTRTLLVLPQAHEPVLNKEKAKKKNKKTKNKNVLSFCKWILYIPNTSQPVQIIERK